MKIHQIVRPLPTAALLLTIALTSQRSAAQSPPTETRTFPAAADVYADGSKPSKNFNSDVTLRASGSPARIGYLRFAVAGLNGHAVLQARLRLGVAAGSAAGGTVHRISSNAWDEATLTFATRPAVDGTGITTLGAVTTGTVVDVDLGTTVTGDGTYSFAIDSTSSAAVSYNSAAATRGQKPVLVLTVASGPDPVVRILQPRDGAGFFVGDPVTLQAWATDPADGDLSTALAWHSDVSGDLGTGPAVSPFLPEGSHHITSAVTDSGGFSGEARVAVTVGPRPPANTPPLVAITAPVAGRTFTAGVPITLTGTANDLEDGDLTSGLAWTSDRDGALGTGGSFAKALTAGIHRITARATDRGALTGSAEALAIVEAPVTLQILPTADAYVDSAKPTANFGTSPILSVDANSVRNSYLRFVVSGVGSRPVARAVLRLQVGSKSAAASPIGGTVHTITDGTWQEQTITFANKPAVDGPASGSVGAVKAKQVVDFDLTGAITGDGTYNLALVTSSTDNADYGARESATPPKLVLTLAGNAPMVAIMLPPNQAALFAGTTVDFSASASDVEDGDLSAGIRWTSSLDGDLGTGSHVSSSSLRLGTHTIVAEASDHDGHPGRAEVRVRVRGPNVAPTVAISAPTDGASIPAGVPFVLAATAADDFDAGLVDHIHWTSSQDGDLGIGGARTVALHHEGLHTLTAAVTDSDGAPAAATVTVTVTPTPPVVTISGPTDGVTVFQGTTVVFAGSAIDGTDGDLSAALHWTSSLDHALGNGPSVVTGGLSVGRHTITAHVLDAGGLPGEATRTLVVRPPNVPPALALRAPVDAAALLSGKPVVLSATATDVEDGDLGPRVRWTSSLSGVLGSGGTLTLPGLAPGAHTLTVTVTDRDGATVSASVNVAVSASALTFVPVADTYVEPGMPTKVLGSATSLIAGTPVRRAYLRFAVSGVGSFNVQQAILRLTVGPAAADGGRVGGTVQAMLPKDAWSEATTTYNTRPAVTGPVLATRTTAVKAKQVVAFDVTAGIAGDGVYNLALLSTNADWVRYQSRESAQKPQLLLALRQNTAPVVTIATPVPGTVTSPGVAITLQGSATDAESGNLSGQIEWTSNLDGPLGRGATLVVPTLGPGAHTITARVTDPNGAIAEARTSVTVDHPPLVTIAAPADHAILFTTDGPVMLRGTATDAEDGDLTDQLAWTSSLEGALGTGGSVSGALVIGTHTITATATDASHVKGRAQLTLRVRGPNLAPVVTITHPAAGGSVPAGTTVTLTATAGDDFDGDLGSQIAWSSDLDGPLGSGPSRTLVLHHEGLHTLTAAATDSDGAPASASITLRIAPTAPVVGIDAPAADAVLFENGDIVFGGTATDATDGDLSASLVWTFETSELIGTGATFAGHLHAGTHTITASVSDAGGLPGTASRTVLVRPPDVPPTLTIEAPTDGTALFTGRPLLLVAHAMDLENGDLGPDVVWTSDHDGTLGHGAMLNVSTLSAGAHIITARVRDHDGAAAAASVDVTLVSPTITILPVADTYVDGANPAVKFGTASQLYADTSPDKQTLLRFVVSGVPSPFTVQRARLRLTAGSTSVAASPAGGEVHTFTDNTWSEDTTTYANRPVVNGPTLGGQGAVAANQVVDFDVTAGVHGDGTYNFVLLTPSADEVVYQSREATTGRPQLVLDLRGPDDPQVTITAPLTGAQLSFGQAIVFTGSASDPQDGALSAAIRWTSNVDGPLGTGAAFTHVLSPGTHTIAATVSDSSHTPASAAVTVTVGSSGNVGFRDFTYPSAVGTAMSNEATAQKPESHLWFLDHTWWATLYSTSGSAHHIHRLDKVTQRWIDTGVFIDERPLSRQDCLWNGDKLYMTSRTGYLASGSNRLLRYSYDPTLKTYFMDPGFPVTIPGGGTESLTIAQDSTGQFWLAYTWNNTVYVAHSIGDDMHWSAPFVLPATQGLPVDADDIGGVIAMDGKIGVFWTNQAAGGDYFAWHPDTAAPTASWTTEVAVIGNKAADDHFNMKFAADGRLFVVMKTSRTGSSDILVGLLVRAVNGTWSPMYNVGTFGGTWGTRGLVQLDELHRRAYIFYSPFHQTIYYKTTDMDSISLPSGLGIPFIVSSSVNDINNPTGTKQTITPESGIEVIASSPGDLSYWHNGIDILP